MRWLLLLFVFSGCTYSFIPYVPEPLQVEYPIKIVSSGITISGSTLSLSITAQTEGFVSVIWYEGEKEALRESIYVDAKNPTATFSLKAKDKNSYRAVVLLEGKVVRQFEHQFEK